MDEGQLPVEQGAAAAEEDLHVALGPAAALPAHVADLVWGLAHCQVLRQVAALEPCRLELHGEGIVLGDGVLREPAHLAGKAVGAREGEGDCQ